MDKAKCPSAPDSFREVKAISIEIASMVKRHKGITSRDKMKWLAAISFTIGGVVAAPFSAGISLIFTVVGIIILLLDILDKLRETKMNEVDSEKVDRLTERLEFLHWCLKP